jgi:hypothetical protein
MEGSPAAAMDGLTAIRTKTVRAHAHSHFPRFVPNLVDRPVPEADLGTYLCC